MDVDEPLAPCGLHFVGTVIVYLFDGRQVDLSGLSIDDAVEAMRAAGVTSTRQIQRTEHRLLRVTVP